MLSNRKMLMCANRACHFRVNQDSACGGYCCKWCHVAHALELCPPEHGQTCERLSAPSGAIRAQPRPPDGHLSTNNQNIEKRRIRPASDLATASTAGNKHARISCAAFSFGTGHRSLPAKMPQNMSSGASRDASFSLDKHWTLRNPSFLQWVLIHHNEACHCSKRIMASPVALHQQVSLGPCTNHDMNPLLRLPVLPTDLTKRLRRFCKWECFVWKLIHSHA